MKIEKNENIKRGAKIKCASTISYFYVRQSVKHHGDRTPGPKWCHQTNVFRPLFEITFKLQVKVGIFIGIVFQIRPRIVFIETIN